MLRFFGVLAIIFGLLMFLSGLMNVFFYHKPDSLLRWFWVVLVNIFFVLMFCVGCFWIRGKNFLKK